MDTAAVYSTAVPTQRGVGNRQWPAVTIDAAAVAVINSKHDMEASSRVLINGAAGNG